jgi:hypothetical protein
MSQGLRLWHRSFSNEKAIEGLKTKAQFVSTVRLVPLAGDKRTLSVPGYEKGSSSFSWDTIVVQKTQ